MYRHNPLPQSISRPKLRRSIVFSSPKFDKYNQLLSHKKQAKSQSRERSIHRIDSKQKPKMLFSPIRKRRNFETSTSAGKQSQTMPFSRYNKPDQMNDSKYISVSDLLEKRDLNKNKNIESFLIDNQKIENPSQQLKITRIINPLTKDISGNLVRIKHTQNSYLKIDLSFMILNKYWQIYEGQYSQLTKEFHGYGCIKFLNGARFMGFFENGKPQGHGTYYESRQDNQVIHGIWHQGQLVQIL